MTKYVVPGDENIWFTIRFMNKWVVQYDAAYRDGEELTVMCYLTTSRIQWDLDIENGLLVEVDNGMA